MCSIKSIKFIYLFYLIFSFFKVCKTFQLGRRKTKIHPQKYFGVNKDIGPKVLGYKKKQKKLVQRFCSNFEVSILKRKN